MTPQSERDRYLDAIETRSGPEADWLRPSVAWRASWLARAAQLEQPEQWERREGTRGRSFPGTPAHRKLARLALTQGFALTRAQVAAGDIDGAEVRRHLRSRTWSRPRRGALCVVHPGADRRVTAALAACAASVQRPGAVVSHQSAAVLHGLPVRGLDGRPMLTTAPNSSHGQRNATRWHRARLTPDELSAWFGVPVTSVPRTVADLARTSRADGLIAADAALRERLTTRADLDTAAMACTGWPGSTSARWVAAWADAGSESPLESLVRAVLLEHGVPSPILQARISDPSDGWHCRVDMLWREQRVILEADGQVKYGDDGRSLWLEKRRQERLERLGFRVVRVLWADIEHHPNRYRQPRMGRIAPLIELLRRGVDHGPAQQAVQSSPKASKRAKANARVSRDRPG